MNKDFFKNSGIVLTIDDINQIEDLIKIKIPKEIKDLYTLFNGGIPKKKYLLMKQVFQ